MKTMETKQLTLHLPPELYSRSARMAKKHRMSLNELARRGLEKLTDEEAMKELAVGFDLVGSDADSDVERYLPAQGEVIFGDDE